MKKRWRCLICGYIHVGAQPPHVCPICNAPQKMFELMDDEGIGEKTKEDMR